MPLFSIIIPTYNRAHIIKRAITSVLNQSYPDFEIIVVDDGSIDNTRNLIEKLSSDKIRYFKQNNGGVSKARNFGAAQASGQYLIFLDSDDELMDGYLREVENYGNENPDIIFVSTEICVDGLFSKRIYSKMPYGHYSEKGLFLAGTFVVKRTVFMEAGGYDDKIKYGENTELSFRLAPLIKNKKFIETPLVRINQLKIGRDSTSPTNLIESTKYVLKKHQNMLKEEKDIRFLFNQVAGVACLRVNQFSDARRFLMASYLIRPYQVKTLFRLLLAYLPLLSKRIYK